MLSACFQFRFKSTNTHNTKWKRRMERTKKMDKAIPNVFDSNNNIKLQTCTHESKKEQANERSKNELKRETRRKIREWNGKKRISTKHIRSFENTETSNLDNHKKQQHQEQEMQARNKERTNRRRKMKKEHKRCTVYEVKWEFCCCCCCV